MNTLANESVEALTKNSCRASAVEVKKWLMHLPGWSVTKVGGTEIDCVIREYQLESYQRVIDFHNAIAKLAEDLQHHPEMITQYGTLTVKWWSHSVGGLHKNDFILAAKCDRLNDS